MLDGHSEQYEHVCMVTLLSYFKYSHIFCINTLTGSNDNSSFRNFINLYTYNNYLSGVLHNPIVNFFIQSSIKKIEPCRKFKILDASKHRPVTRSRGVLYNIKMYKTWLFSKTSMYIWFTLTFFALIPCVLSSHFRGGLLTWNAVNETQVRVHLFNIYIISLI